MRLITTVLIGIVSCVPVLSFAKNIAGGPSAAAPVSRMPAAGQGQAAPQQQPIVMKKADVFNYIIEIRTWAPQQILQGEGDSRNFTPSFIAFVKNSNVTNVGEIQQLLIAGFYLAQPFINEQVGFRFMGKGGLIENKARDIAAAKQPGARSGGEKPVPARVIPTEPARMQPDRPVVQPNVPARQPVQPAEKANQGGQKISNRQARLQMLEFLNAQDSAVAQRLKSDSMDSRKQAIREIANAADMIGVSKDDLEDVVHDTVAEVLGGDSEMFLNMDNFGTIEDEVENYKKYGVQEKLVLTDAEHNARSNVRFANTLSVDRTKDFPTEISKMINSFIADNRAQIDNAFFVTRNNVMYFINDEKTRDSIKNLIMMLVRLYMNGGAAPADYLRRAKRDFIEELGVKYGTAKNIEKLADLYQTITFQ